MCWLPTQWNNWYLVGPIYWWHCFPFGCPSLGDHSLRDGRCHVPPFPVLLSDRLAPNHSAALLVMPTHFFVKWAVQPLQWGFIPAFPMRRASFRFLGWWWPLIMSNHTILCLWNNDMAYHSSPQMMQTDDAQKSSVSWSSTQLPIGMPRSVPKEKKKEKPIKGHWWDTGQRPSESLFNDKRISKNLRVQELRRIHVP